MYGQEPLRLSTTLPPEHQYMLQLEQGYTGLGAKASACAATTTRSLNPPGLGVPAGFRLAARQARRQTAARRAAQAVETYFDPLPFYYAPLRSRSPDRTRSH